MKKTLVLGVAALAFGLAACTETDRYAAGPNDETITADVKRTLQNEGVAGNIQVSSNDGVVTLSGSVPSEQAKARAEDIADDINGVDSVQNNLRTTMAGDAPLPQQERRIDAIRPDLDDENPEMDEGFGR